MEIKSLIEELIDEHQEYTSKMNNFEKKLNSDFSQELLKEIIQFLETDIKEHADKEEKNLNEEVEKVYLDFDSEAISFAHNVIDEAIEDLKWEVEKYQDKDKIIRLTKKIFNMIKDHFSEEENFLFPNIYKENKEWI